MGENTFEREREKVSTKGEEEREKEERGKERMEGRE